MMRAILFILLTSMLAVEATAQDIRQDSVFGESKTTSKRNITERNPYFFYLQSGTLIGCSSCSEGKEVSFTIGMIHGLSLGKKLRVGAGIGFDSYAQWQTFPLFGSMSWDLLGDKNTNALFVQFNYGWARPWLNKAAKSYGYKDTEGGRMFGMNLGYRIRYHDLRIAFAVGLKDQNVSLYYEYPTYYTSITGQVIEGKPSTQTIEEELKRLQFTMAIGWK